MATVTSWCRLWHDMPTDPKWKTIAKRSGKPVELVIAVMNFVMVNASHNVTKRGVTHNLSPDDIGAALDRSEEDIQAVLDAMKGKVLDDKGYLTGWEKRQPKREDSSADRTRKWRENSVTRHDVTQCDAPDSYSDNNINKGKSLKRMNGNGKYKRQPEHGDKTKDGKLVYTRKGFDGFEATYDDFHHVKGMPPELDARGGFWAWWLGEASREPNYRTRPKRARN